MKKILLLTESDVLTDLSALPLAEFDGIVLAFWASPEFAARVEQYGAKKCWRLNDFLLAYPALIARAFELAHDVAESMPRYRQVNPWRAWENVIANALLIPLVMAECHTALCAQFGQAAEICFLTRGDMQRAFAIVNQQRSPSFETRVLREAESSKSLRARGRFAAWVDLFAEAKHDGDWRNLFHVPLEILDAQYAWRSRFATRTHPPRGSIVCYSTYINFSRALAPHARRFESPAQWIVNSHSARKGLAKDVRAWNLWQFGAPNFEQHGELLVSSDEAPKSTTESIHDFPLRAVLSANSVVSEIRTRVMPRLLAEIDMMTRAIETCEPREVWVANQWGGEGCFLQVAQAHQAPTVQVQHGVLEPYFGCAPLYSDSFLVWSEFWRNAIPECPRQRVHVAEETVLSSTHVPPKRAAPTPRLTFFTSPPDITPLWNPSVAAWEVVTLLGEFVKRGYAVTLRAHPMDQIARYERVWESAGNTRPIQWDKGTSLDARLAETDVAAMMFSTTALDCVARGIPVIGLGWYDFVWKRAVQNAGYIRYGESLGQVVQMSTTG